MKDNILVVNCDVFNWQILLQFQQDLESKTKETKNKTDDLQSELNIQANYYKNSFKQMLRK